MIVVLFLSGILAKSLLPAKALGLSAAVYTQVSDVEQEINGLLTYDRKELKVIPDDVIAMNRRLMAEME